MLSTFVVAQNNLEDLVKEGIVHHDNGDYEKALSSYNSALELDPKSELVHYELALTYMYKGDYKASIKHSEVVIKQDGKFVLPALIAKGSCLDNLGKTKQSIKLFEKSIKKYGEEYLLCFNLAVNYAKMGDNENAEKYLVKGLGNNFNHPSSHYILASIKKQNGEKVPSLLSYYYFLFLEPNSDRSKVALQSILDQMGGNVKKDANKENTININLNADGDDDFMAAELMIAMLEASKHIEENEGKSDEEMFVKNSTSLFMMLGEMKKRKNKGIFWEDYIPFFYDLAQTDHIEAFCYYILYPQNEVASQWLENNQEKLDQFDKWLKQE